MSNKINYSILQNEDKSSNKIVIKYKPTMETSQDCYIIIRNNLYGDFIYFMKGMYVVKKKNKRTNGFV